MSCLNQSQAEAERNIKNKDQLLHRIEIVRYYTNLHVLKTI